MQSLQKKKKRKRKDWIKTWKSEKSKGKHSNQENSDLGPTDWIAAAVDCLNWEKLWEEVRAQRTSAAIYKDRFHGWSMPVNARENGAPTIGLPIRRPKFLAGLWDNITFGGLLGHINRPTLFSFFFLVFWAHKISIWNGKGESNWQASLRAVYW